MTRVPILRPTPLPGLRNVEHYAEWVEWGESLFQGQPRWYASVLTTIADVVRNVIAGQLNAR